MHIFLRISSRPCGGSLNAVEPRLDRCWLSGPANITSKTKKAYQRFSDELEAKAVGVQWRILSAEEARSLHARVIADDDQTYEVPPLNSVLAGTVDSIRASDMPLEAFEEAWSNGAPLLEFQALS